MNHSHASSQRCLTGDVLDEALHEINKRRFDGLYEIRRDGTHWQVHHTAGWTYGFSCWLKTQRTVEFRPDPGDWASWSMTTFQDEVAAKFKGRCSDETSRDIREPEPARFPTYKSWWYHLSEPWATAADTEMLAKRWTVVLGKIPEVFRKFA